MKNLFSLLSTVLFAALIAGAGALVWSFHHFSAPGPLKENRLVLIVRGTSVNGIAEQLMYEGVVENGNLFMIGARLTGAQKKLQAGEYEFPAGISMKEVLALLASGKTYQRHITIPEGLTVAEIVGLLNAEPALSGTIDTLPPEGSLLPETYNFSYGDSRAEKIQQMQAAQAQLIKELCDTGRCLPPSPLTTPQEVINLASIVEKETGVNAERAKVAGVFFNRLRKGMALQSDPTVIYALTKGLTPLGRPLTTMDLAADSPWNTYKNPGLPPGPIANPGRAAIEAVFAPETHGYFYFVADGTGGHAFAATLEGHNKNVAAWRKIQKSAPAAP